MKSLETRRFSVKSCDGFTWFNKDVSVVFNGCGDACAGYIQRVNEDILDGRF